MSLNDFVYVTSNVPFHAFWDGVEYELGETPVKVKRGTAELWGNRKDVILTLVDVPEEARESRPIINPLDNNERGEAFSGLVGPIKKRRRT